LENLYVVPPPLGITSPVEEAHLERIPKPDPIDEQPEETIDMQYDHNGDIFGLLTDDIEEKSCSS